MTRFAAIFALTLLAAPMALPQAAATQNVTPTANRKATTAADNIISGTVTNTSSEALVVVRRLPAHADEIRTFIVDKDTQFEGKLKAGAQVRVRFRTDAGGTRYALRVIVRPPDGRGNTSSGRSERTRTTR